MHDIRGLPLTFYGHFSGYSSYPVVCDAIARWLISRGVRLFIANLRGLPIDSDLVQYQIPVNPHPDVGLEAPWSDPSSSRPGAALLFGFPEWHQRIPRHQPMLGYHVGDVSPLPMSWARDIDGRCDRVLTASKWCAQLFSDLGIKADVVRHGFDPEVCRPPEERPAGPTVLRHYCSSPDLDRKGTIEVLEASRRLLTENEGGVTICVTAPGNAVAQLAERYQGYYAGGQLTVSKDRPRSRESIVEELQQTTAVVQPSRAEGFGLVPLEAVACGTPVIVTDATGHSEYVQALGPAAWRVRTGYLEKCSGGRAPSLDTESLYRAMRDAVQLRDELRRNARRVARTLKDQWSWDAVLDADLFPILASLSNIK